MTAELRLVAVHLDDTGDVVAQVQVGKATSLRPMVIKSDKARAIFDLTVRSLERRSR